MENAKIQKLKCDIMGDFQTLCQGADWTNKETKIVAKKLWSIASKPGRAIRQYLRAHPGYPVNRNLAFQIKPSPQKVKK